MIRNFVREIHKGHTQAKHQGKNSTVYTIQENLTPDHPIGLVRYIPMKTDEIGLLDIRYVTFNLTPAPVLTTPASTPGTQ
jgi:hypothetical protein